MLQNENPMARVQPCICIPVAPPENLGITCGKDRNAGGASDLNFGRVREFILGSHKGAGWPKIGTWEVDRKPFPGGLKAVTYRAHAKGAEGYRPA